MLKNHNKAFSLLELVFVIIITGILAIVALPRFVNISDDAHVTKLKAFIGTFNRSVGPALWSGVQRNEPNQNGILSTSTNYAVIIEDVHLDVIPTEFLGLGTPATISLVNCMPSNTLIPDIGDPVGGLTAGKIAGTSSIGNTTYALGCIDGGLSSSPKFYLYDEVDLVIIY